MSSIQSTLLLEVNSSDLSLLPLPVVTYLFQAGVLCPQRTQKGLLWAKFIQRIWMPILIILWWKCQIQHHNQKNMPNKTPFTPYSYQIHHHNTNTKSLQIPITPQCWFTRCFVKNLDTFWRIISKLQNGGGVQNWQMWGMVNSSMNLSFADDAFAGKHFMIPHPLVHLLYRGCKRMYVVRTNIFPVRPAIPNIWNGLL